MPDLTDTDIKEALAIKVMGYDAWVWDPLNKIEHAMQLIPKMREKGWLWDGSIRGTTGEYGMAFYNHDIDGEESAVDPNPARAISMAAYEVVCR